MTRAKKIPPEQLAFEDHLRKLRGVAPRRMPMREWWGEDNLKPTFSSKHDEAMYRGWCMNNEYSKRLIHIVAEQEFAAAQRSRYPKAHMLLSWIALLELAAWDDLY